MKIDKFKLSHWIYLAVFICNVTLTLPLALFPRRKGKLRIILYGHKLNGNLLAIYREAQENSNTDCEVRFLTMDPAQNRRLRASGICTLLALNPLHIAQVALCHALVSDHGLHSLLPFLYIGRMKFIDVWHGIPFKGFDAGDFRVQHRYDRVLLPSDRMHELYTEQFGFPAGRLVVTGYARTDLLRRNDLPAPLAHSPSARKSRRIIMYAPTWKQDDPGRSIFPFDMTPGQFFEKMQFLCEEIDAVCIMRTHLNTATDRVDGGKRVFCCPSDLYPDTEHLLVYTDLLICDWSSIAFDFLLLNRPTIFLDVPPPFKKGFSLGPEYRFGYVAKNVDRMFEAMRRFAADPDAYKRHCEVRCSAVKSEIYGPWADGGAARRCLEEIAVAVNSG